MLHAPTYDRDDEIDWLATEGGHTSHNTETDDAWASRLWSEMQARRRAAANAQASGDESGFKCNICTVLWLISETFVLTSLTP